MKALERLQRCTDLSEHILVAYEISAKILCAGLLDLIWSKNQKSPLVGEEFNLCVFPLEGNLKILNYVKKIIVGYTI